MEFSRTTKNDLQKDYGKYCHAQTWGVINVDPAHSLKVWSERDNISHMCACVRRR